MLRIDTHHHVVPPDYRTWLTSQGVFSTPGVCPFRGGVPRPTSRCRRWRTRVGTAILSVSTPGTAIPANPAARLGPRATSTNTRRSRSRHTPTGSGVRPLPLPDVEASVAETAAALDELRADGIVLLATIGGTYLGEDRLEPFSAALDTGRAVVFMHPAESRAPRCPASRRSRRTSCSTACVRHSFWCVAAYGARHPKIRFILSHGGGFVPYAGQRMAIANTADTGRSPADIHDDCAGSTSTPRCRPTPPRWPTCSPSPNQATSPSAPIWPFAPTAAGKLFAAGLETYPGIDAGTRAAIERTNALALFPRLGAAPQPISQSPAQRIRHVVSRSRHARRQPG